MSTSDEMARAWVDVDLAALVTNAQTIADRCGRPLLPMVKANAYGLGAVPVVRALERLAPWGYGVATVEEGAELRAAGLDRPILVFTPMAGADPSRFLRADLRPVLDTLTALDAWLAASDRPFHVEIDTGMGRAGFRWDDAPLRTTVRQRLESAAGFEGIFTHFHSADTNPNSIEQQWERLQAVVGSLSRRPPLVHAANSAAALLGPKYAADLVRPGIFLYGGRAGASPEPKPVAHLRSRIVAVRAVKAGETVSYGAAWTASHPCTIATLGIGYGDGLSRQWSDRGLVELGGTIVPIVGRVTMDMTMVAVEDRVTLGQVATHYGGLVTLDRAAELAGTISYELLTALGGRVRRCYSPIG